MIQENPIVGRLIKGEKLTEKELASFLEEEISYHTSLDLSIYEEDDLSWLEEFHENGISKAEEGEVVSGDNLEDVFFDVLEKETKDQHAADLRWAKAVVIAIKQWRALQ